MWIFCIVSRDLSSFPALAAFITIFSTCNFLSIWQLPLILFLTHSLILSLYLSLPWTFHFILQLQLVCPFFVISAFSSRLSYVPPQTLLSWAFLFSVVFLREFSCDDCCWLIFFLTSGLKIRPVGEQFDKTPWLAGDSVYVHFMFIRANLGGTEAWSSLNVNC